MRSFILGTDWWTDCDDCVAMRLLLRAHKRGDVRLLGVAINACMEYSAPSVDGFMQLEGVTGIPIGIDKAATDFGGIPRYQKRLAEYAVNVRSNDDAQDAVRLYRRLLADSDKPVEILEIGYFQAIAALLESGPDDISDKPGLELFQEKVKKVWVMAGNWVGEGITENNFFRNSRTQKGAVTFCGKCPVPVTFLGYEVGYPVITGSKLADDDFLHLALKDHGSAKGRPSWDPMLVMLALIGNEEKAGYRVVRGTASVNPEKKENYFAATEDGLHSYVVKTQPDSFYEDMINDAIQ